MFVIFHNYDQGIQQRAECHPARWHLAVLYPSFLFCWKAISSSVQCEKVCHLAISYSSLVVRSNRIHRIFNHSISPGPVSQVVITCLLISIQVLVALVWLVAEPPSVKTVELSSGTLELRCGESPYFGLSVSLCYNLFLLVLSTYFAFLTRKVSENFNEVKFINVTMYSLCIIWFGFFQLTLSPFSLDCVRELLPSSCHNPECISYTLVPKIFIVILDKGKKRKEETFICLNSTKSCFSPSPSCRDSTRTQVISPPSFLPLSFPSFTLSPDSTNMK